MPTYEFVCKGCSKRFSVFTTVSGRDRACCPECQGNDLQQIFKGVQFLKSGGTSPDIGPSSMSPGGSGCSGTSCSGCSGCG